MTETDDPADAAARLEDALERIAVLVDQTGWANTYEPEPEPAPELAIVAERLDALIANLRAVLSGRPG